MSRTARRDQSLRWFPFALGLGGLAGAWRTMVALGAPTWPTVGLTVLCGVAWLAVTTVYLFSGGSNPRSFTADMRHADQGFAVGYLSVIPMLLVAQVAQTTSTVRFVALLPVAVWALTAAALVSHWITTPRDHHAIHPGFSLPVVAGPFIASISLQANGWHALAQGSFAIGAFFWLMFGTLITGRLMTQQRLSDSRFPTLVTLMVPPATASNAWFSLSGNRITAVSVGLAAILAMLALIQLFILPDYVRHPFTIATWVFSFPLASTANVVGHWAIAESHPAATALAWATLAVATSIIGLLAVRTAWMIARVIRAERYRR
ncbi:Tellurite resistance protein TehA [Mycolicibacterium aubagnense]